MIHTKKKFFWNFPNLLSGSSVIIVEGEKTSVGNQAETIQNKAHKALGCFVC
jgi:hypothetical protein